MRRSTRDLVLGLLLFAGIAGWAAASRSQMPAPPPAEWASGAPNGDTITCTPQEPVASFLDAAQVDYEKAAEQRIYAELAEAVIASRARLRFDYSFTGLGVDSRPSGLGNRLASMSVPFGAGPSAYRLSKIHLYVRESLSPDQQRQVTQIAREALRRELAGGGVKLDLLFSGPSRSTRPHPPICRE